MNNKSVIIISGVSGSGKTTLCLRVFEYLRGRGIDAAGVISPPFYENGVKTKILVRDLRSAGEEILASMKEEYGGPRTGPWHFSREGLNAGSDALRRSVPCEVLIIDEIGPMELLRSEGWHPALGLLKNGNYGKALVPMRPKLTAVFAGMMPSPVTVGLTPEPHSREAAFDEIIRYLSGTKNPHLP